MSENGIDLHTPLGRIVWGSPTKPRGKTDKTTKLPVLDKEGNQVQEISFGVAYSKADFQAHIWPTMAQEIATVYPNIPGRFAYKYVDGDGVDGDGKLYSDREGYAGCYVLAFNQRINAQFPPPPIFKLNPSTGGYDQLSPDQIKCGDFVAVGTNFKCEPAIGTNTPSIYVNPRGVEFVYHGKEIVSAGGFDPKAAFAGRTYALPPGASATPVHTPGAGAMPGMGAAPPPAAPGGMPGMPAAPAPVMAPPPPVAAGPADPSHRHNNGNGTEQWLINGQWDGGQHPIAQAAPTPPPVMAPPPPVAPAGPVRPVDPSHVHDNGNGTEQWLVNGQWDGGAHPVGPAAPPAPLPPPAAGFVAGVTGAPAPGMPPMPGMPPR